MTSARSLRRLAAVFALLVGLATTAAGLAAQKPSLVVVISVDQMRADYLERFQPYFGKDGFNRFLERGAVFTEARHRHAYAETAPGHASIGSGLDPRHHGILSNRWFDPAAVKNPYVASDPQVKWVPADVSGPDTPASPVRLDEASLGDRLKESYPKARVVGVALKDRAAVFMAGRKADAAVWFDAKSARFVTSTYYPPRPSLLAFNGAPLQKILADPKYKEWGLSGFIPAADLELETVAFDPPELTKYKDPVEGMGEAFPHSIKSTTALITSPFGDELILDYARFAIRDLALGRNPAGAPDLLFIGMSSTDLYGHKYGPNSREIADGMARLDRTLERFWHWLDAWQGKRRVLVFLSADHGVTPIPEVAREKARREGHDTPAAFGRTDMHNPRGKKTVAEAGKDRLAVERGLASTFGYTLDATRENTEEAAIVWFEDGFVYLNRPVLLRRGLDLELVKSALAEALRGRTGVAAAYTNTQINNGLPADAPGGLAITRSFRADRAGDVYAILNPGWIWFYERDAGTTHGEPNEDDLHVPVAAWGAGVAAGRYDTPTSPLAIAKTVGALFGFEVGEPDVLPLAPVLGSAQPAVPAKKAAAARQ